MIYSREKRTSCVRKFQNTIPCCHNKYSKCISASCGHNNYVTCLLQANFQCKQQCKRIIYKYRLARKNT